MSVKGRRRRGGKQTKDHKVKLQAERRNARLYCPRCDEPDCVCEVDQEPASAHRWDRGTNGESACTGAGSDTIGREERRWQRSRLQES
jgi:hypothetical protein